MSKKKNINDLTLGKMEDGILRELFLTTRSKIHKERGDKKRKNILKKLEEDLCYIQREMTIRNNRKLFAKKLHARVSNKN
jgi:hypothetical protein